MIFGIGCDLCKMNRFESWHERPDMVNRFFAPEEILSVPGKIERFMEYYAGRFSAKEAFAKALGTGVVNFSLAEIYVTKDNEGKPSLNLKGKALEVFEKRCGKNARCHLSISHDGDYVMSYVVIEN